MRISHPTIVAVAGFAMTLALTACGSTVSGTAEPSANTADTAAAQRDHGVLQNLLIDPSEFPEPYSAVVLPQDAVAQAAPDLTGIPADSTVDPAGCKPAEENYGPTSAALIVGTDNSSRATITIELTVTSEKLAARRAQLQQCPTVTADSDGAVATVKSEVVPPPPIDADDTLAVQQTVTSGSSSEAVTRSLLTLVAQTGDLRVSATFMSFGAAKPDTESLNQLFTSSVEKVNGK